MQISPVEVSTALLPSAFGNRLPFRWPESGQVDPLSAHLVSDHQEAIHRCINLKTCSGTSAGDHSPVEAQAEMKQGLPCCQLLGRSDADPNASSWGHWLALRVLGRSKVTA